MDKVRIGDICTVVSGSTPKSNIEEYWNGDIKWITPAEITDDSYVISDTERHITEKAVEKTNLTLLPVGAVLLSSRAPIGKTAIVGAEMYCNQGFKNLICSERIYNKYLYFFLTSKVDYLNALGRGATFKEISKGIVEDVEISLPSLDEQKKIAERFEAIQQLISKRKQVLLHLDNLVKSRFVEMFGDLAFNTMNWPSVTLVDTCVDKDDIKCGPFGTQLGKDEYVREGVPLWGIPQINAAFTIPPTDFLTEDKAEQLSAYSLLPGDIAMSRKGNVGKCAIYPENSPNGIIHSDVLRIRVDNKRCNPLFMMCQLHFSRAIEPQIAAVSNGAVMAGINVTKLKSIVVHVPPIELQKKFADFVSLTDKSKFAVQQSINTLQTLKAKLMQAYFK